MNFIPRQILHTHPPPDILIIETLEKLIVMLFCLMQSALLHPRIWMGGASWQHAAQGVTCDELVKLTFDPNLATDLFVLQKPVRVI